MWMLLAATVGPAWRDPSWVTAMTGLLSALVGGLVAALTGRRRQTHTLEALKSIKAKTDAVNENVSNDHKTNLRDDVDRVQATVDRLETAVESLTTKVKVLTQLVVGFEQNSRERDEVTQVRADVTHEGLNRRLDALEAKLPKPGPDEMETL